MVWGPNKQPREMSGSNWIRVVLEAGMISSRHAQRQCVMEQGGRLSLCYVPGILAIFGPALENLRKEKVERGATKMTKELEGAVLGEIV